jgi:hypothetical protein
MFVFSCRSVSRPALGGPRNRFLTASVAASVGLLALTVYTPPLNTPFGTAPLGLAEVGVVLGCALAPFAAAEAAKAVRRRRASP